MVAIFITLINSCPPQAFFCFFLWLLLCNMMKLSVMCNALKSIFTVKTIRNQLCQCSECINFTARHTLFDTFDLKADRPDQLLSSCFSLWPFQNDQRPQSDNIGLTKIRKSRHWPGFTAHRHQKHTQTTKEYLAQIWSSDCWTCSWNLSNIMMVLFLDKDTCSRVKWSFSSCACSLSPTLTFSTTKALIYMKCEYTLCTHDKNLYNSPVRTHSCLTYHINLLLGI